MSRLVSPINKDHLLIKIIKILVRFGKMPPTDVFDLYKICSEKNPTKFIYQQFRPVLKHKELITQIRYRTLSDYQTKFMKNAPYQTVYSKDIKDYLTPGELWSIIIESLVNKIDLFKAMDCSI